MEAKELIKEAKSRVENAMHRNDESQSSFLDTKTVLTFIAGAAIGVGIGVYLASDSGKEWRDKLGEQFDGIDDKIKDTFGNIQENIRSAADKFTEKAKEYAGNANGHAEATAENTQI